MSEVKLLPCPFCGGEAEPIMVYVSRNDVVTTVTRIVCKACGANTDNKYTEANAIYSWNTRKPMDDIVERLEDNVKKCSYCEKEFEGSMAKVPISEKWFGKKCSYETAIEIVKGVGGSCD